MTPAQKRTIEWLANGEVGASSKQLAMWLAFDQKIDNGFGIPHPEDPDYLDRCLKYLHRVPEARVELYRMAEVSPEWKALVERWDEIETLQMREVGLNWTKGSGAPETYKLMRSILDPITYGDTSTEESKK